MQRSNKLKNSKKILVVRNDKLGDLLVSFSTFATLKKNLPDTEIHVLVSKYTAPMAQMCKYIDRVIVDPTSIEPAGKLASFAQTLTLIKMLKQQEYEAVITLFSSPHVALAVFLAKIPVRISPATKIQQFFYNHRLIQRRSRSEKPEHRYNQELAEYYLSLLHVSPIQTVQAPFLAFDNLLIGKLKQEFMRQHKIPAENLLVFIHPGSGGSARNISSEQFALLANSLQGHSAVTIVVSYGPGEDQVAKDVYARVSQAKVLYESNQGLGKFSQHLQFADCFISGSTGPLHIAGVLDRPTAAFYTRRRSATSLRWQTLNSENKRLAFSPVESADAEDMSSVNIAEAAIAISEKFLSKS